VKRNCRVNISEELKKQMDEVRAEFTKQGKKPPSIREMTKNLSKKIKKEDLVLDEYISFQ